MFRRLGLGHQSWSVEPDDRCSNRRSGEAVTILAAQADQALLIDPCAVGCYGHLSMWFISDIGIVLIESNREIVD